MVEMLNRFDLAAVVVKVNTPKITDSYDEAKVVVRGVEAVKRASRHPVIIEISPDQNYYYITRQLIGTAEAVMFSKANKSFKKIEEVYSWVAVQRLANQKMIHVIGSGVSIRPHLWRLENLGARAYVFKNKKTATAIVTEETYNIGA